MDIEARLDAEEKRHSDRQVKLGLLRHRVWTVTICGRVACVRAGESEELYAANPLAKKHYNRMMEMWRSLNNDLLDLAKLEHDIVTSFLPAWLSYGESPKEFMQKHGALRDKLFEGTITDCEFELLETLHDITPPRQVTNDVGETLDILVHGYVARTSTMIDNMHYFVAQIYGIETEKGFSEKQDIREGLKDVNSKLRKHLRSRFAGHPSMQKFNRLRNTLMHGLPEFDFATNWGSDLRNSMNLLIEYEDAYHPVFDFLFESHEYMTNSLLKTYELVFPLTELAQEICDAEYGKK